MLPKGSSELVAKICDCRQDGKLATFPDSIVHAESSVKESILLRVLNHATAIETETRDNAQYVHLVLVAQLLTADAESDETASAAHTSTAVHHHGTHSSGACGSHRRRVGGTVSAGAGARRGEGGDLRLVQEEKV